MHMSIDNKTNKTPHSQQKFILINLTFIKVNIMSPYVSNSVIRKKRISLLTEVYNLWRIILVDTLFIAWKQITEESDININNLLCVAQIWLQIFQLSNWIPNTCNLANMWGQLVYDNYVNKHGNKICQIKKMNFLEQKIRFIEQYKYAYFERPDMTDNDYNRFTYH